MWVVNIAEPLPVSIEDCARPKQVLKQQRNAIRDIEVKLTALREKFKGKESSKEFKKQEDKLIKQKSQAQVKDDVLFKNWLAAWGLCECQKGHQIEQ